MSPAENGEAVVEVLSEYRKQLSADRILLHFFIVACFGYKLHSRFELEIFSAGLSAPAEFGISVLYCIVMTAVLFKQR